MILPRGLKLIYNRSFSIIFLKKVLILLINKWRLVGLLSILIAIFYLTLQFQLVNFIIIKTIHIFQIKQKELNWFNDNHWTEQDDPQLINIVKERYLFPPSTKEYNLTSLKYNDDRHEVSDYNPSGGQVQRLEEILTALSPGFFVESGAMDGIFSSNSLWLERTMKWEGLLVEAHPKAFEQLQSKHRKAWTSNLCLSVIPYPVNATFYGNDADMDVSALSESDMYDAHAPYQVQCIPLYTILAALGRTTIDFFSLDVEGNELDILKTIPFDKIIIKVLTVEHTFIKGELEALQAFMDTKGYIFYQTLTRDIIGEESILDDAVFIHPSLQLTDKQKELIGHLDPPQDIPPRV